MNQEELNSPAVSPWCDQMICNQCSSHVTAHPRMKGKDVLLPYLVLCDGSVYDIYKKQVLKKFNSPAWAEQVKRVAKKMQYNPQFNGIPLSKSVYLFALEPRTPPWQQAFDTVEIANEDVDLMAACMRVMTGIGWDGSLVQNEKTRAIVLNGTRKIGYIWSQDDGSTFVATFSPFLGINSRMDGFKTSAQTIVFY